MSLAPDDPRHGTATGYKNHGCRCDPCKQANSAYMAWLYRRPCVRGCGRMAWHGPSPTRSGICIQCNALIRMTARHGTESMYTGGGCRCDECRKAQNEARAQRRKRPNVAVHGTNSGYSNGCRCDACREEQTVYSRERKRRLRDAA